MMMISILMTMTMMMLMMMTSVIFGDTGPELIFMLMIGKKVSRKEKFQCNEKFAVFNVFN